MRRPTFGAAPHLSTGNADSLEIPETPSVTEKMRCPVHPSVVRVVGKRLDAERPRYLILCWMYPQEGETANSDLDRRFREYDEKISRDLAQQQRLPTLRSRKHFPWTTRILIGHARGKRPLQPPPHLRITPIPLAKWREISCLIWVSVQWTSILSRFRSPLFKKPFQSCCRKESFIGRRQDVLN
jgi:hypothetical protein